MAALRSKKRIVLYSIVTVFMLLTVSTGETSKKITETLKPFKSIKVGKGPDAIFFTPDDKFVYVANVEDKIISIINVQNDSVIQSITDVAYPWGFTRLGKSNLLAVSGWGKDLAVINFKNHKVARIKKLSMNLGGRVSDKSGQLIYVVATEKDLVLQINSKTLDVIQQFNTGKGPDGIGISYSDNIIYVTNTKEGTISIIDIKKGKSSFINTGGKPELIHSNHSRDKLFISNYKLNKVHVLNTKTNKIEKELLGLNGPEEAVLSTDEKILYVVNFKDSKIFLYDAKTFSKLNKILIAGKQPIGITVNSKLKKGYVTNFKDNTVSVYKF